jgi:hypothetical protein
MQLTSSASDGQTSAGQHSRLESTKAGYQSPIDRSLPVAVFAVDAGIQALTILSLIKSVYYDYDYEVQGLA